MRQRPLTPAMSCLQGCFASMDRAGNHVPFMKLGPSKKGTHTLQPLCGPCTKPAPRGLTGMEVGGGAASSTGQSAWSRRLSLRRPSGTRSHPEAEPKDEDEEGALTGHPRNPTHVAPFSGGPPNVLGDTLGKELIEEPSMPEPLPAPRITNNILEEELTEEPSVPEPLPAPRITNDILEEELIEETSMPEPLPTPCITNDILGKVLIEDTSVPGPSILTDTPKEAASVSEPLVEPSIADNYLQQELLKGLQHDYVQQQLRVRRISQQFPHSLQAINLQIGHTQTRLIRSEVQLQRWEREDVPAGPAALLQPSGSDSSLSSASLEAASIPPSTSTSSLLLHPSPPPLEPDLSNVKETLQSLVEMQVHQLRDRQRDLSSCQECLQSFKVLRGQLRLLRSRLARVEATMGIVVPPRELDVAKEEGEGKLKETTVLLFT